MLLMCAFGALTVDWQHLLAHSSKPKSEKFSFTKKIIIPVSNPSSPQKNNNVIQNWNVKIDLEC